MSVEELKSFIVDQGNGLHQSAEINGTRISVTFRPSDMWVEKEVKGEKINKKVLDSLRKKYADYYYFILSVSQGDEEVLHLTGAGYSELVETMSFRMPEYIMLTTAAQDTIPVADFMMNRTYGLSVSTDVIFSFNKKKTLDDEWIQFNLKEFGLGLGDQRFRFSTNTLEEIPRLHFTLMN